MRPGQNKRMRGRNNNNNGGGNRKGPNPLTRSYESNGPDVKIRGTAHHIGEKYLQLARDAQSSGDPVMAESYLQHAEHYFRLIATAQQAQQQAAYGYQRPAGEQAEQDDDGDDDFDALPDRFASPAERVQAAAPTPQPAPQPYQERQPYNNNGQPFEQRQERYQNQQPQPNFDRQDRQQQDRQQQDRQQPDRQNDRQYDNRGNRGGNQDRPYQGRNGQDRGQQDRNQQDRNQQDRSQQDRAPQERQDRDASSDRPSQERPARDFDNRGFRNNRGPREFRDNNQPRQPVVDEPSNGLPAFITAPSRVPPVETVASTPVGESADTNGTIVPDGDDAGFHLKPRRRRRPKAEFAGGDTEAPTADPVGD